MPKRAGPMALAALACLAGIAAGCAGTATSSGSFERTLSVTGPARLELQNGSGNAQITAGEAGQVRVRGEFRVRAWSWENLSRRVEELSSKPPIEQQGNLVRVGFSRDKDLLRSVTINYTIVVPAETELQAEVGSGSMKVRGIHGPVRLSAGSGGISAERIREDVQASTGSGGIALAEVGGEVRASTGSGSITMSEIRGDIRASTGSGGIAIAEPGGRINAKTGSGGVTVHGAAADLRASAGSGHLSIEGNPTAGSYWELRTGSGGVDISVPAGASFRLHAHSGSGGITLSVPAVIEERSRHEMRARVGSGAARIEVRTSSGGIHIR